MDSSTLGICLTTLYIRLKFNILWKHSWRKRYWINCWRKTCNLPLRFTFGDHQKLHTKNCHHYKCTSYELSFLSKHFEKKYTTFFSKVGSYTVGLYSGFKICKTWKSYNFVLLPATTIYDERNLCWPLFQYIYFPWKIQSLYCWRPLWNF